jgi:hypothetical protein
MGAQLPFVQIVMFGLPPQCNTDIIGFAVEGQKCLRGSGNAVVSLKCDYVESTEN